MKKVSKYLMKYYGCINYFLFHVKELLRYLHSPIPAPASGVHSPNSFRPYLEFNTKQIQPEELASFYPYPTVTIYDLFI